MRRLSVVICLTLVCVLLSGCNEDVTVYVNGSCNLVYEDGTSANPLELDPKDKVKWVNDNDFDVDLTFDGNTLFGQSSVTIKAGKSKNTTVKPGVSNYEEDITMACGRDGGSGNPKVKVSDEEEGGGN